MAETQRDAKEPTGDFASFLATTRPKTVRELTEELRQLVNAVIATGKSGSITYTIQIKTVDGGTDVLAVNDQIKVNKPEHDRKGSLVYPDADGNLSRTDPNQMPLFDEADIRTAPTADPRTGEIKDLKD